MYRITVNTSGEYGNVALGARYCLTRKTAIKLANLYFKCDYGITIEKLICIHGDIFTWSDVFQRTEIFLEEDEEGNITARKATKYDY